MFKEDRTIIQALSITTVPAIDWMILNPGQKTAANVVHDAQ